MFTFGREHERKRAIARVSGEKNAFLIGSLIDSVHDLLEHKAEVQQLTVPLEAAFIDGGSGVWEQAANWLKRLSAEYPELASLWLAFAEHLSSRVRFRVACCLDCVSAGDAQEITVLLASDVSHKVRQRLETEPT